MEKSAQYKILVTGGAGFIGSNLCEHFLALGHMVTCLDNFSTGHHHNLKDFIENSELTTTAAAPKAHVNLCPSLK